jgi:hypothetical protein
MSLSNASDASPTPNAGHEPCARESSGYRRWLRVVLYSLSVSTTLNQAILLKPPLPEAARQQLPELFGHLVGVGLELSDRVQA